MQADRRKRVVEELQQRILKDRFNLSDYEEQLLREHTGDTHEQFLNKLKERGYLIVERNLYSKKIWK